jgi:hypothetical protein
LVEVVFRWHVVTVDLFVRWHSVVDFGVVKTYNVRIISKQGDVLLLQGCIQYKCEYHLLIEEIR